MEQQTINVEAAIKNYKTHMRHMKNYNEANKEKIRARAKLQYEMIKADPEKYEEYKIMKRNEYHIRKAKLQQQQAV